MNIERTPLREQLAGEYVLGSLRGPARQRFEALMQDSPSLREAVSFWENALQPMLTAQAPQTPQRDLLPAVEQRLGWHQDTASSRRLPRLPLWAFGLMAAFSILLWAPWQTRIAPDFALDVATTQDDSLRWQIAVDKRHNWIDVRVVSTPQVASDRDLELWLLVDGGNPVSLGLLSETDGQVQRIKTATALSAGNGLAVSVEPQGGSPSGAPTGPVIAAHMFPSA